MKTIPLAALALALGLPALAEDAAPIEGDIDAPSPGAASTLRPSPQPDRHDSVARSIWC